MDYTTTDAHLLYAFAIAILFGLSVGIGVVVLFPDPAPPPIDARFKRDERPTPEEGRIQQKEFQRQIDEWRDKLQDRRRNQLITVTLLSAVALIGGIAATGPPAALRLGGILGGIGTVVWGVIYSDDYVSDAAVFAIVLLVFIVLAALTHPVLRPRMREISHLPSHDSLLGRGSPVDD